MPDATPEAPTIRPTRPVAPWLAGKTCLARRLCALIDADARAGRHTTYAEPFVGMGGVFLRRTARPACELVNDHQREVYNLFRMVREHYGPFLDLLRFQAASQAEFDRLVMVDPDTLTEMQRAARFFFLQRTAFGGKIRGQSFGLAVERSSRFNMPKLEPDLEALSRRLAGVTITCLDFAAFIDRVDRPSTLFYLDPPYFGSEGAYGRALFARDRFEALAGQLARIRGRFILSLNDVPEARAIFGRFNMAEIRTTYRIAARGAVPDRAELVISNFDVV